MCIYVFIFLNWWFKKNIINKKDLTWNRGDLSPPLSMLIVRLFSNLIAPPSSSLSPPLFPLSVPGAPPRKLEVEAINSTAIRVTWKPPLQGKQHGQIRGYQVIFSRLENGEPRSQPNIMDVALPEAQVLDDVLSSLPLSFLSQSAVLFQLLSFYTAPFFHSILWAHTSFPPYQATHVDFILPLQYSFSSPFLLSPNIF